MDKRKKGGELIVHINKLKLVQLQNPHVVEDANADDSDDFSC